MRTFAEELVLITALALGVSAVAAPPKPLSRAELTELAAAELAKHNPAGHIIGADEQAKVLAARDEVARKLVAMGYDVADAVAGASKGVSGLPAVLNPCGNATEDKDSIAKRAEYEAALNVDKSDIMCASGAKTLDKVLASQSDLYEKLAVSDDKKGSDEKGNPNQNGAGSLGSEIADAAGKAAKDGALAGAGNGEATGNAPAFPTPAVNPAPAAISAGTPAASMTPRSAPQFGPMMGTAARGSSSAGGYDGHKGFRPASLPSDSGGASAPDANQNVEILRQALDRKILQREITPAVADTLMNKLAPVLRREGDLASALEKTQWDRPAASAAAKTPASPEKPESPSKPSVQKSESSASTKPASSKAEGELAVAAANETGAVFVLNGATNGSGLTDLKKGLLGDSLASSIASAIEKKGAPLPSEEAAELPTGGDGAAASTSPTSALTSGGLFESDSGNAANPTPVSKTAVQALTGNSLFKRLVDKFSQAYYGDSRKPASTDRAAFEHFQETESVALASFGRGGEITLHPQLSAWTPAIFFFTPFTLTLVGFALWRWRQRRRA